MACNYAELNALKDNICKSEKGSMRDIHSIHEYTHDSMLNSVHGLPIGMKGSTNI